MTGHTWHMKFVGSIMIAWLDGTPPLQPQRQAIAPDNDAGTLSHHHSFGKCRRFQLAQLA